MSETAPLPSLFKQWYVVAVLLLMYIFSYIDRSLISLLVDPIRKSLDIDDLGISLIQGASFGIFYALFGLPMGWVVDRFSKQWVLFSGITIWSLSTAACGLARTFAGLAGARFGVGAGEATLVPIAYSTIARTFPPRRVALATAVFSLGSSVGSATALIVGGIAITAANGWRGVHIPLVGQAEPWQIVFFMTGLPGLLVALLAFSLPKEAPAPKSPAATVKLRLLPFLKARRAYLFLNISALALTAVLAYAIGAWAPTFFLRVHGLSVREAGTLFGIAMGTGGVTGYLVSGTVSDRFLGKGLNDAHMRPLLFAAPLLMLLAVGAFLLSTSALASAVMIGMMSCLWSMANPIASHIQLTTPPELRGRLAAITVSVQQLMGISIGPTLVALITQYGFRDPLKVNYSIAISVLLVAPMALLCLIFGLKHARSAMAETMQSSSSVCK